MNSQWKNFLLSHSARIDDAGHVTFDDAPDFPECALIDLSHLGLIRVSGEDAVPFLQGQLTSDVRDVTDGHFQWSGYCTPKGRMLASFLLFRRGSDLLLQLPQEILEPTLKRLSMFVLLSKVQLQDASEQLVSVGLAGDCAPGLLQHALGREPAGPGDAMTLEEITILRLPGAVPRFQLTGEVEAIMRLWEQFAVSATPANRDLWSLFDIRAGIPTVYPQTMEAFVPQMANMDLIDGVSFTKGCYTGQEVVARMKYLGKLKRRMFFAHVDTDDCPNPGSELFSPGSESSQGAGKVVDARPAPGGGCDLLAVVEIARAEADDIHLEKADGPKLQFRQLPYGFEQESG